MLTASTAQKPGTAKSHGTPQQEGLHSPPAAEEVNKAAFFNNPSCLAARCLHRLPWEGSRKSPDFQGRREGGAPGGAWGSRAGSSSGQIPRSQGAPGSGSAAPQAAPFPGAEGKGSRAWGHPGCCATPGAHPGQGHPPGKGCAATQPHQHTLNVIYIYTVTSHPNKTDKTTGRTSTP